MTLGDGTLRDYRERYARSVGLPQIVVDECERRDEWRKSLHEDERRRKYMTLVNTFIPHQNAMHPADTLAIMAAIIGSSYSPMQLKADPDLLIDAACDLYDAVTQRYVDSLKGSE